METASRSNKSFMDDDDDDDDDFGKETSSRKGLVSVAALDNVCGSGRLGQLKSCSSLGLSPLTDEYFL